MLQKKKIGCHNNHLFLVVLIHPMSLMSWKTCLWWRMDMDNLTNIWCEHWWKRWLNPFAWMPLSLSSTTN